MEHDIVETCKQELYEARCEALKRNIKKVLLEIMDLKEDLKKREAELEKLRNTDPAWDTRIEERSDEYGRVDMSNVSLRQKAYGTISEETRIR